LYFGRFGGDAEDPRLPTLFLGYPGLVRGYDASSFDSTDCGVQLDGGCPSFDRLIGSSVAVGNAELRFPLWGLFKRDTFYGPLPVEMAIFGDAGVAWFKDASSRFSGDKKPVASVGAAMRVNLFGFAVGEINYVKPLDRNRGWLWQFNLMPGF
jgi:outer membrane protein assembly factor BamA